MFKSVVEMLRPGGHLVVNVANIRTGNTITPLASDLKRSLSRWVAFRDEIIVLWDQPPEWLSDDYCLVFEKGEPDR